MNWLKRILFAFFVVCIPPIVLQLLPLWSIVTSSYFEICVRKGGFIEWIINEVTLDPETRKVEFYTQVAFDNQMNTLICIIPSLAFYTLMFYISARQRK